MAYFPIRWSETWRVLAYTVAIAIAFIALSRAELALMTALGAGDALALTPLADDPALAREAVQVAQRSQAALAQTPGQRLAAFRLGYELGFASELIGSTTLSEPNAQAAARTIGTRHIGFAHHFGASIGIADVGELPVRNLQELVALNERFEADENGVATRVEQRLAPTHRHLYLLGTQLGVEAAMVQRSGGTSRQPPVKLIRRHAILAGVDAALWQPLALEPRGESPEQTLERYGNGLTALAAHLAALDAGAGNAPLAPAR